MVKRKGNLDGSISSNYRPILLKWTAPHCQKGFAALGEGVLRGGLGMTGKEEKSSHCLQCSCCSCHAGQIN